MTDVVEFDKRVDAFKPASVSHMDWRSSAARCDVALRLWSGDLAAIYVKHVESLPTLSKDKIDG